MKILHLVTQVKIMAMAITLMVKTIITQGKVLVVLI
jgi:hypothetical protein